MLWILKMEATTNLFDHKFQQPFVLFKRIHLNVLSSIFCMDFMKYLSTWRDTGYCILTYSKDMAAYVLRAWFGFDLPQLLPDAMTVICLYYLFQIYIVNLSLPVWPYYLYLQLHLRTIRVAAYVQKAAQKFTDGMVLKFL